MNTRLCYLVCPCPQGHSQSVSKLPLPLSWGEAFIYDWLICTDSEAQAVDHAAILLSHLLTISFQMNCAKSVLIPSQTVTFLDLTMESCGELPTPQSDAWH